MCSCVSSGLRHCHKRVPGCMKSESLFGVRPDARPRGVALAYRRTIDCGSSGMSLLSRGISTSSCQLLSPAIFSSHLLRINLLLPRATSRLPPSGVMSAGISSNKLSSVVRFSNPVSSRSRIHQVSRAASSLL